MLTMLVSVTHPLTLIVAIVLHYIALQVIRNTQLTSSHPAPSPFLWPLRSHGLSSNGEGRMYYPLVTACPNMTRVSVLDTRHESESDVSDDSEDDWGSEAGEI